MYCEKCGTQLDENANFCGKCGAAVPHPSANDLPGAAPAAPTESSCAFSPKPAAHTADCAPTAPQANYQTPEPAPADPEFTHKTVDLNPVSYRDNVAFRPVCLIVLIVCAVLWLFAPFVAVNLITLGDQPTALQFVTDDITYLGDLTDNAEYWASIVTMVCLVICFICILMKKHTPARILAIIALVPMVLTLIHIIDWAGGDFEDMLEIAGIGYWGIFAGFIVLMIDSKNKPST